MADYTCDDEDGGGHDVTLTIQATGDTAFLCGLSFAQRGIEVAKLIAPGLILEAANELVATPDGPVEIGPGNEIGVKPKRSRAKAPTPDPDEYDVNRVIVGVVEDQPRPPAEVYSEHHRNLVGDKLTDPADHVVVEEMTEAETAAALARDAGVMEAATRDLGATST